MEIQGRHRFVLGLLQQQGRVEVAELVDRTGASPITIRRDLEQLAAAGALRRVHGGAVAAALRGEGVPFALRAAEGAALKMRLGEAAAALIADGEAVAIDSGTTGAAAAGALAGRRITAVPMSVQALAAVAGSRADVVVPGGQLESGEGAFVGPLLQRTLEDLRLDTAVLSCCGVSVHDGVMGYTIADAAAKIAARRASARTILIAQSDKFAVTAMSVVCPFAELDVLVSDEQLPAEIRSACRDLDVEVVLVPA